MVLSFSRDVGAAERARGVNRPSLCWIRSWCCSMLLSGSACPHFFQKLSRVYRGGKVNVTVQHVTSHFISRCILLSSGAPGWIRRRTSQIRFTDGYGDQEHLERTDKGQRTPQPWLA